MVRELNPKEAHDAISKAKGAVLLDVRSAPEFASGHPAGALNVPIIHKGMMGMQPNPDFLAVVSAVVPKDKTVFVSCMSGQRSMRACMLMEQNGWKDLTNVRAGWGGARDMSGAVIEPGWQASGLPV